MADLARIKANVAKMAAQNAPEADIDGYIASEGVTLDDVRNFRPQQMTPQPQMPQQQPVAPQPEQRGIFRRVDDAVRGVADMATFGLADEFAAKMSAMTGIGGQSGNYDANLADQRARDQSGGMERFGGQVAGAFLMPGGMAKTVPKAAGMGALMGGAYGFGSGERDYLSRLKSAGQGAVIGGVAGGAVRGIANKFDTRAATKSIASSQDLKKAADAAYKAAEAAGVIIKPQGIQRLATETVNDLANFGYHPQLQPRIGAVLSEMERLAQGNVTYKGVETLRKIASSAGNSLDPSEKAIATKIIGRIDDYMANLPAEDVLTGNASAASDAIRKGRDAWARFRRSEMVDTAAIKAERRAASTGTGGNLENTTRQNVRSILDNPRRSRGMTQAELDMANKVVMGTKTQDALRLVGRLSPTTGGLSAAMNVGATAVNPMMAIPGGIGLVAKSAAERMTTKNVERLSQMIRSGGLTGDAMAKLARQGKLSIPEVQRVEQIAKIFGLSVPELAAAVAERVTSP